MTDPVLWNREPHTAAKHRVLRSYLDGWMPVMAQQAVRVHRRGGPQPRLLLVDGFAGPGRYTGGEPGSPLIMLDAVTSHAAFGRLGAVGFSFLYIEHKPARADRLRREIAALGTLPSNVAVRVEEGEYEATFGRVIEETTQHGQTLIPTFAFIDPFGYASASMSLAG